MYIVIIYLYSQFTILIAFTDAPSEKKCQEKT